MQMISKNSRNGVTLIALVITIVVLSIILTITLNYGLSEIHTVSNKKTESELAIVQEAVMQRYALAKEAHKLGNTATSITANTKMESDTNRPSELVGTRLASSSEIETNGFTGISYMKEYSSGATDLTYEEYYYLLDENDLKSLGLEKGDDGRDVTPTAKERSYIVNYFTGEVFDVLNKKYYETGHEKEDQVYTQPTSINMTEEQYNFNDD